MYTQEWYMHVVKDYQDQYVPGEPGYGELEDFFWEKQANFDAHSLVGGPEEWATWYAEEISHPEEAERYAYLAMWWENYPDWDIPIVVEGTDGLYHPWDGCHRTGISCLAGRPTFPAIVGTRVKQKG